MYTNYACTVFFAPFYFLKSKSPARSLARLHAMNVHCMQPCIHAAMHPCSRAAMQPCIHAAVHARTIVGLSLSEVKRPKSLQSSFNVPRWPYP